MTFFAVHRMCNSMELMKELFSYEFLISLPLVKKSLHKTLSYSHELASHYHKIICHSHKLVSHGNEILSCGNEMLSPLLSGLMMLLIPY